MSDTAMQKVTLRFRDRKLERAYALFNSQAKLAPTRAFFAFGPIFGIPEAIYRLVVDEGGHLTIFRFATFAMYGLMLGVSALTYLPVFVRRSEAIAVALMPCVLLAAYYVIVNAPADRRYGIQGLYYLMLIGGVVLPFSHLIKYGVYLVVVLAPALLPSPTIAPHEQMILRVLLTIAGGLVSIQAFVLERLSREQFLLTHALTAERERSEALLHNILPASIAERLKNRSHDTDEVVDQVDEAAVMFIDLINFTPLSASLTATETVRFLNEVFTSFDVVASRYGLEKIKTIGDAYMVVAGLPEPMGDALPRAAAAAFDFVAAANRVALMSGRPAEVRIGLHAGPVVAGVIGKHKFHYDLWGNTVNLAARLEASALPGQIHVTAATAARLGVAFTVEPRGVTYLKGIGAVETCFLTLRAGATEPGDTRLTPAG